MRRMASLGVARFAKDAALVEVERVDVMAFQDGARVRRAR